MVAISTKKKIESQERSLLKGISFKDFSWFCLEYKIVEKSILSLLSIAESSDTKSKEKIDIYKWLIEMNVGKPKQKIEQEKDIKERISGYTFEVVGSNQGISNSASNIIKEF